MGRPRRSQTAWTRVVRLTPSACDWRSVCAIVRAVRFYVAAVELRTSSMRPTP
jgi:hypothetical protein